MTPALEKFAEAHGEMKPSGARRMAGPCFACDSSKKSTALKIYETVDGILLVRCFRSQCSADKIAASVGLEVSDLFPPRLDAHHVAGPKKRGMLSAIECLKLLEFESMLAWTAAFNLANGHPLTGDDLGRLSIAARRIQGLVDEVRA